MDDFREWMDSLGLSAADVAGPLHVSEQTIRHWRVHGVPLRRQPHAAHVMKTWGTQVKESEGQNLVLYPTDEQFDRWEAAARQSDQSLKEWASASLDKLAEEADDVISILAAREEQNGSAGANDARTKKAS
jgi:hypothetical protein